MSLFQEIVREFLLLESRNKPSESDIKEAIEGLHCVSIMYNDQQGGLGKSWRYTYPVAYGPGNGTESSKHRYIRLFMTKGSTKRGQYKWKLLRVDRIVSWYTLDETLDDEIKNLAKRGRTDEASLLKRVFSGEDVEGIGKINFNGDKQLNVIYHCPMMSPKPDIDSKSPVNPKPAEPEKPEKEPEAPKIPTTNIDNIEIPNYNKDTEPENDLTAPETQPILKKDIGNNNAEVNKTDDIEAPDTEPVLKTDLEEPENDLTPAFKDMWDRWNKLDKEKEEENGTKY